MEVSLTSNHRTLSLTSRSPSAFSLSDLRSIRAQFLGRSHSLRPPGCVRSRHNKCKKLRLLQPHSPRFLFKASLSSYSVVVGVTLVTLSAVYLFYYNHIKRKKKPKEILGHPTFALSQQGSNIGNQAIESQILCFQEFQGENLLKEIGILEHKSDKENHDFDGKEAQLTYWTSPMVQEEAVVTEKFESPSEATVTEKLESPSDVLSSSVNIASSSDSSKVVDESHLSMEFQSSSFEPLSFAAEMTEIQVDETRDKALSDSELPIIINKSEHTASFDPVNNEFTIAKDRAKEKIELGAITSDVLIGESTRQELYMFYEVNMSSTGSMSPLNGLKSPPAHASFMKKKELQSTIGNNALKRPESLTEVSLEISELENVEGAGPRASHKEGYPHQNGSYSFKKRNRSLGNRGKTNMDQRSDELLPQNSESIREHVDQKNRHSQHLRSYNSLLKDGRLHDCVELLKDMEMKGILDMTKVYHAKFFNICKRQKAVREAFEYIKLVPNPKLSTFNMLMSVCSSAQDSEGAFQVLQLVQGAGFKPDCKLYTTLISTYAKSGEVDQMFEVFHNMVNSGIEPNVYTYGALIDGCARAGQVAKAFGAYGILRSKKLKPDRVVFNALIAACAQSGAVDRAFDVLAEMAAELQPIEPDHITIGALMKACANAGQVERARQVYKLLDQYGIKGTPEVYTIAINSCSQTGDWEFVCSVYSDMIGKGVFPDEMFLSALIDFAGHAGKLDAAFEVLQEARKRGIHGGKMLYSTLMGACSNAGNWERALELYKDLKSRNLVHSVSTVNALITALCDGDQFPKAMEVLSEMKELGLCPNSITYSILIVASEKKDDLEAAQMLLSQAKMDGVSHNPVMRKCIIGMCLRRYERDCNVGEPGLSFDSRQPHVNNKWTSLALMVYREMIRDGTMTTSEILSQIFGCLKLPYDASLKNNLIENLGVSAETSKCSNLCSLIDGFGEYDPRAFSLLEEAASLGIVPFVSFKVNPIVANLKELHYFTAEVYLLTVLKGLKHRLAAGAKLPNLNILLPVEKTKAPTSKGEKLISVSGRAGQAVAAMLRRLRIPYQGNESFGKIRISGVTLRKWLQPKLASPFSGKPGDLSLSQSRLGKSISLQQRNIRTGNLSLD
ncbi:pentatricopeptide repeat-containing protein MRL1, chloroplastic [Neltuma alba]|uniref:pentatricopeptide repeat-containing protein MRL1, chloroplastic n=1 Tax=Neltuma alba TaxID=207710 RepID=UPI0010A55257|nr:pentatricopeptide repeat-containing protein MRL1, chloroplastic [Prosopis alba]